MTASLPEPTPPASRAVAGDRKTVDAPAQVPENLVIPPRPPLPEVAAGDADGDTGQSATVTPPDAEQPQRSRERRKPWRMTRRNQALAPHAATAVQENETDTETAARAEPLPEPQAANMVESVVEVDVVPESEVPDEPLELVEQSDSVTPEPTLLMTEVTKHFGGFVAVDAVSLRVEPGAFVGIIGPNGAGKTTMLSMVAGLLRPSSGSIRICGVDARAHERDAKQLIGVLPDRLRTFDRLSGRQLLNYAGLLRGLAGPVVEQRVASLARTLELEDALGRVVSDYSAGMTKKLMLAVALIHAPRMLVLDEPFEALDPASAAVILDILHSYTAQGGTVLVSSHSMELVESVCDRVAVLAGGELVAAGTMEEVCAGQTLAERYAEIVGAGGEAEGLEWLHSSSD